MALAALFTLPPFLPINASAFRTDSVFMVYPPK
jgi:hypothetical protein